MSRRVIDPERLRDVMFVTCSHGHTDHMDPVTLAAVRRANDGVQFIAPRSEARLAAERWGPASPGQLPGILLMNDGESHL